MFLQGRKEEQLLGTDHHAELVESPETFPGVAKSSSAGKNTIGHRAQVLLCDQRQNKRNLQVHQTEGAKQVQLHKRRHLQKARKPLFGEESEAAHFHHGARRGTLQQEFEETSLLENPVLFLKKGAGTKAEGFLEDRGNAREREPKGETQPRKLLPVPANQGKAQECSASKAFQSENPLSPQISPRKNGAVKG